MRKVANITLVIILAYGLGSLFLGSRMFVPDITDESINSQIGNFLIVMVSGGILLASVIIRFVFNILAGKNENSN